MPSVAGRPSGPLGLRLHSGRPTGWRAPVMGVTSPHCVCTDFSTYSPVGDGPPASHSSAQCLWGHRPGCRGVLAHKPGPTALGRLGHARGKERRQVHRAGLGDAGREAWGFLAGGFALGLVGTGPPSEACVQGAKGAGKAVPQKAHRAAVQRTAG